MENRAKLMQRSIIDKITWNDLQGMIAVGLGNEVEKEIDRMCWLMYMLYEAEDKDCCEMYTEQMARQKERTKMGVVLDARAVIKVLKKWEEEINRFLESEEAKEVYSTWRSRGSDQHQR